MGAGGRAASSSDRRADHRRPGSGVRAPAWGRARPALPPPLAPAGRSLQAVEQRAANEGVLNPIEQVFAKLKALLRKAAPRTREALWRTIGEKLSMFTPAEYRNYLRHCGYGHPV